MPTRATLLALFLAGSAQAQTQEPLSVIDWLTDPPENLPGTVLMEPPVTQTGMQPDVQVTPLDALSPPLGLVASSVTGLPVDLWQSSDADRLAELISQVRVKSNPAMQRLLFTLLLSEARPPAGGQTKDALLMARLDRLMQLGASDPVQSLVQLAGPTDTQDRFKRWFDATLLTGDEDRSCTALIAQPNLSRNYAAQIFCKARRGDWSSAALTLEAAHALQVLPEDQLALLDRFLSPELFEGAEYLPQPDDPDPLTFRIFEAIGERLPTASLPRAFANADLRDVAGWKAQIEAAERLTRIGALTPNQLLGLYTERSPAASGAVWDRVSAIQKFEAALETGDPEAVSKALTPVWAQMKTVDLEVPFAELFAPRLVSLTLPNMTTENLRWRILLLSELYEDAARTMPNESDANMFLSALAQGDPQRAPSPTPQADAISQGFAWSAPIPSDINTLLINDQLGEAILETMQLFAHGARGNLVDLTAAIATFRRVGLEDTARRAALQIMILNED
ncbi:hypothetical protein SAMN05444358_101991 [Ruegeria halocynthiae]|uniref:Uncharacterized protein n=1 Tax=Ruegeria halocynthiae TaxID=985054 RepID=A0A1H2U0V5_9RHOB|nr:hypothetical protein [Ruegeria halocynthiae]SDW49627.1 hypothetical protein SAMN05444358_101991 [Ruegeria halocynthiae]